MSLSKFCVEQHEREQAGLRKLLLFGLLGSVGVHIIVFALTSLGLWQGNAQAELSPIEILVMEPPPEPIEEPTETIPAELSSQTNDPAPAPAARVTPETTVAAPPQQPAEVVEPEPPSPEPDPEPEPVPETEVESELEEPEEPEQPEEEDSQEEDPQEAEDSEEAEETETTDEATNPSEEVAVNPSEVDASRLERIRELLRRNQPRDAEATSTDESPTEATDAESAGTGELGETENRTGTTDTDNGTNPSSEGSGSGRGSRTVACQSCVEPQYPESALEAGAEGSPRVQVDINPDGTVRSVTLVQSSGNAAIDQAAIQAARSSSFQPVAGGASVPIEYNLTIEGSRRNQEARRRGDLRSVEVPNEETETTPQTAREAEPEAETTSSTEAPQDETGAAQANETDSNTAPEAEGRETPQEAESSTSDGSASEEDAESDRPAGETADPEPAPSQAPDPEPASSSTSEPTPNPAPDPEPSTPEPASPAPQPAPEPAPSAPQSVPEPTPEPTPATPEAESDES